MASKLLSQYGFSKDNLKVLLGGWNTWNERHGTDPNGYPTDTTAGAPPTPVVEETAMPIVQPVGMPSTGAGGMDVLLPLVVLALFCLVVGSFSLVRPSTKR